MNQNLPSDVIDRSQINLGIVCPMANEKQTAVEFIKAVLDRCTGLKSVRFFAIFDNACRDGTFDLLKALPDKPAELQLIWSPENTCVVDAYIRGYTEALAGACDWILEIDAGFSHQPRQIPQFLEKAAAGYDCVFANRFCRQGKFTDAPLSRRFISRAGSILANLLLGTKLKDMTSGFELFTKDALEMILERPIRSRGHFFQTEIKAYCRNLNIAEVPIHYRSPSQGVNSTILADAFVNLFVLFIKRLKGRL